MKGYSTDVYVKDGVTGEWIHKSQRPGRSYMLALLYCGIDGYREVLDIEEAHLEVNISYDGVVEKTHLFKFTDKQTRYDGSDMIDMPNENEYIAKNAEVVPERWFEIYVRNPATLMWEWKESSGEQNVKAAMVSYMPDAGVFMTTELSARVKAEEMVHGDCVKVHYAL